MCEVFPVGSRCPVFLIYPLKLFRCVSKTAALGGLFQRIYLLIVITIDTLKGINYFIMLLCAIRLVLVPLKIKISVKHSPFF